MFIAYVSVCYGADEGTPLIAQREHKHDISYRSINHALSLISYGAGAIKFIEAWYAFNYDGDGTPNYHSDAFGAASTVQLINGGICGLGVWNWYQGRRKQRLARSNDQNEYYQAVDQQDCGWLLMGLSSFMQSDLATYFLALSRPAACVGNLISGISQITIPTYAWMKNCCSRRPVSVQKNRKRVKRLIV